MKLQSILTITFVVLIFSLQAISYDVDTVPVLKMRDATYNEDEFNVHTNIFPAAFNASEIVGQAKNISIDEAMVIAQQSPEITYFIKVYRDLWGGELPIPSKRDFDRSKVISAGTVLFLTGPVTDWTDRSDWTDPWDRYLKKGRWTFRDLHSDDLFDLVYIKNGR